MSEAEAHRLAEVEGLQLVPSSSSASGFKGISHNPNCSTRPFQAQINQGGKLHNLGYYSSAIEAALAYARHLGTASVAAAAAATPAPAPAPMSEAEARRLAEVEGLQLVPSSSHATGFKGVYHNPSSSTRPFHASIYQGGKTHNLGSYSSACEAALAVARYLGPASVAAAAAAAPAAPAPAPSPIRAAAAAHTPADADPPHTTASGKRRAAGPPPAPAPKRGPASLPGPVLVDESGEWYQVEQLLAVRQGPSGRLYLVRWRDYGMEHDSWEPEAGIDPWLVHEFENGRARVARPSGGGGKSRRPTPSGASAAASCSSGAVSRPAGAWRPRANSTPHQQRLGAEHQVHALPACEIGDAACEEARPAPTLVSVASWIDHSAAATAAMLTAAAFGSVEAFCFVAPCDCGLGLFARAPLQAGQFIGEYGGPRLPLRLQVQGRYVLQVLGTTIVIDGASENSPFDAPRSAAVHANHSARPNAHLESWPVLRPGPLEVCQHVMLVATEAIEAGAEIRIDYENGGENGDYWKGAPPAETSAWRQARVPPPAASLDEPVYDRLVQLQAAAELRQEAAPCPVPHAAAPIPWDGPQGGDARLRAIVPLLSANGHHVNQSAWPLVSTHVPGRSGRECRDRWQLIDDEEAFGLLTPATAAVSHADAAAAARKRHLAAAAAAAADASGGEGGGAAGSERCCISGCSRQLLRCNGHKQQAGDSVGCAQSSHVLCAPCLERWFASQAALREENGLPPLRRRACPVCKTELRATGAELRADVGRYAMGLLKVAGTW